METDWLCRLGLRIPSYPPDKGESKGVRADQGRLTNSVLSSQQTLISGQWTLILYLLVLQVPIAPVPVMRHSTPRRVLMTRFCSASPAPRELLKMNEP